MIMFNADFLSNLNLDSMTMSFEFEPREFWLYVWKFCSSLEPVMSSLGPGARGLGGKIKSVLMRNDYD